MTEQMQHDQAYPPPVLLRQAREAAGLHIAALAAALKVPVKKLEALEAGRYHELPDLTFARALASSACRHLKIDPSQVLAQIPMGHQPALGDTSSTINAPFRPVDDSKSALSQAAWLRRPSVLVSLVLLAGAAGLALMPDWDFGKLRLQDLVSSPSASTSQTAVVTLESPAPPPAGTAEPASAEVSAATPAPAGMPSPTAPSGAAPAAPDTASAPAAPSSLLHIEASGESWVEVVDGAGRSQVQRMMKAGEVLDFSSNPPYAVVVGRADAVTVMVRGQRFDIAPYARNSVARFQVK